MRCERIYTSGSEVKQLSQGIGLSPPSVKLQKISNLNRLKNFKAAPRFIFGFLFKIR